jgi:5-methylthioadenosine/S-adenosylhomocysteine deaminase
MRILIRGALLDGVAKDILVEDGRVARVAAALEAPAGAEVIDARGMAALPSLVNAHAHSAMTLLRGAAEDLALDEWLKTAIWPREAEMTEDDIYWGTRLAALEMVKTGTTLCHDMYLNPRAQARAAADSGMRFVVNYPVIDGMDDARGATQRRACLEFFDDLPDTGPLVSFNLAAHSVYATSEGSLRWLAAFGRERGLGLHIHLAETEAEVRACRESHGMSPAAWLGSLGFLGSTTFAAHAIWLDEADLDLVAARGVTLVHNPVSNMKLASGPAYDWEAVRKRGIRTLIGTDGCASNNSLDLFADMKVAALLQKQYYRDARRLPVAEVFDAASAAGHEAFGTGAGAVAEGRAADIILVDLRRPGMVPLHDLKANLVYSGGGTAVDTVVCAGRVLMRGGRVEGEAEVLEAATRCARDLAARCGKRR